MECGKNQIYKPKLTACHRNCLNKDDEYISQCPHPDMEGCDCVEGMVMSGNDCVPTDQCGCLNGSRYYVVGYQLLTIII
jgi:hypothetical protein